MTMLSTSINIIPSGGTTLVEQRHADIDKDIAALLASLSVLRSRRNTFASIFSLPPEILATIFTYIVEEVNLKIYTGTPRRGGAPTSMIVIHVCRHWRQVALECPSLWTFIDSLSARWVVTMLERSKEAALVVIHNAPVAPKHCVVEQLLLQLPRIKVLEICSSSVDVNRILNCLSSQPAPLLQVFKFSVLWNYHRGPSVRPISDTIFQGRAPLLRSVELAECSFSLTSCIFSGLQTLNVRIGYPLHLTLSQLLAALRRMPDLEQLALELPSAISEGTELFDQVPLTRLRSIALDGCTIRTAVYLFSRLVLPVDPRIALNLTEIENPQSFSDLFSTMHKHPDGSVPIIRSLRAKFSHIIVGVQFSTLLAFKSEYSWRIHNDDIRLSIQFRYASNPAIIFDMCQIVSHHKIQSLFVSTPLDLSQHFWRVGFAALPELESIHLSQTTISGFIHALMTVDVPMAYPLLRALKLDNIELGRDELEDLRDIARMRAKGDIGIHKLRLTNCSNVMEENLQLLEEVIADVDWDEHEVMDDGFGNCLCPPCLIKNLMSEDPYADAHSED
ncbi:hypothetical protein EDB19DRAFT_1857924 [Suillus lakei]|nr:hypothetical protein EDB19DRAFT_1857924 [Suillus lakei]